MTQQRRDRASTWVRQMWPRTWPEPREELVELIVSMILAREDGVGFAVRQTLVDYLEPQ